MKASGVSSFPVFSVFSSHLCLFLPKFRGAEASKSVALTVVTGWFGLAVVILFKSADMCRYLDIKIWSLVPALL